MQELVSPPLDVEVTAKLELLAKHMSGASDDWCLIGGAALALWGVHGVGVRDIDVLLSERDALVLLGRLGIALSPLAASAKFRSKVYAQVGVGIEYDFMAGFEVNTPKGWVPVPPRPEFSMVFGGLPIYLPGKAQLARILTLFNRQKDMDRLHLLEAQFTTQP